MTTTPEDSFTALNIRVESPDGLMFVTVAENQAGKPWIVLINIGKNGANLMAWANAMAQMVTNSLQHGVSIVTIANDLLGNTSDKAIRTPNGLTIGSGPEALAFALLTYAAEKTAELQRTLGNDDDEYGWLDDTGTFPRE